MSPNVLVRTIIFLACLGCLAQIGISQKTEAPTSECSGIVRSVDYQKQTLSVRTQFPRDETIITLRLGPDAKLIADGKPIQFSVLKMGSPITCTAKESDSEWIADTIVLLSACDPKHCAKSKCGQQCGSVKCTCPKSR